MGLMQRIEKDYSSDTSTYPGFVLAYYGALKGLEAKHSLNPAKMIRNIAVSLKYLDEAVQRSPDDLEVRFVRFASLHHFPPVLGIGKKRAQDIGALYQKLIEKDYSLVDRATQKEMAEFLLKSKRLSSPEQKILRTIVQEL